MTEIVRTERKAHKSLRRACAKLGGLIETHSGYFAIEHLQNIEGELKKLITVMEMAKADHLTWLAGLDARREAREIARRAAAARTAAPRDRAPGE